MLECRQPPSETIETQRGTSPRGGGNRAPSRGKNRPARRKKMGTDRSSRWPRMYDVCHRSAFDFSLEKMARVTGLEPATSGVTGRHSNRLSYTRAWPPQQLVSGRVRRSPKGVKPIAAMFVDGRSGLRRRPATGCPNPARSAVEDQATRIPAARHHGRWTLQATTKHSCPPRRAAGQGFVTAMTNWPLVSPLPNA